MKPLSDCRLYTFVDTAYLRGRAPELVAQQLCNGGSDLIQLRAKNFSPDEIRPMARAILPVTQRAGVGLVINDHPAIATEVGAEFCHLGQEDFFDAGNTSVSQLASVFSETGFGGNVRPHPNPLPQEREKQSRAGSGGSALSQTSDLKAQPLIGLSTHSPEQAERALAAGPAYIAIGPVYATGTKPAAKPVTLDYVRWAAAKVAIPWFAIGGINLQNLDEVLAAGARRICVVSAILNAPDVAEACREFKRKLL
jgi:thiamine-phosphate pyrophosphorylase